MTTFQQTTTEDDPGIAAIKALLEQHIAESRVAVPTAPEQAHYINAVGNIIGHLMVFVSERAGDADEAELALANGAACYFTMCQVCCPGHMLQAMSAVALSAVKLAFEEVTDVTVRH